MTTKIENIFFAISMQMKENHWFRLRARVVITFFLFDYNNLLKNMINDECYMDFLKNKNN